MSTSGTVASPSMAAGATQTGAGPYGTVPTAPDITATQQMATQANMAQMAQIQQIMAAINQQNIQSQKQALELNMPGYGAAMGTAMGNIAQGQAGQIPGDVWNIIQRMGAERGVAVGSPVSPNMNAAMLGVLGKTSLSEQQRALDNLRSLMAAVPRAQPWDPSSLLITPEQVFNAQYLANVLRAAPDPSQAAAAELAALQSGAGRTYGTPYFGPTTQIPTRTGAAPQTPDMGWFYQQPSYAPSGGRRTYAAGPTVTQTQPVIDTQGDEWVNTGGNEWMNLSTGDMSTGMPGTSVGWSYQAPSGTSLTWTPEDLYSDLFSDYETSPEAPISDFEAYWGVPEADWDYYYGGD